LVDDEESDLAGSSAAASPPKTAAQSADTKNKRTISLELDMTEHSFHSFCKQHQKKRSGRLMEIGYATNRISVAYAIPKLRPSGKRRKSEMLIQFLS
jgi:hypothetical protein